MLKLAFLFLAISLIAGLLGYTGLAGAAASMSKFMFSAFLIVAVLFFLGAYLAYRKIRGE